MALGVAAGGWFVGRNRGASWPICNWRRGRRLRHARERPRAHHVPARPAHSSQPPFSGPATDARYRPERTLRASRPGLRVLQRLMTQQT